ncbi:MAG: beta-lactamase family protein [Rhodospirillaceae bacterium]|nr:beta-lactamase family protein [Rhodospirillaceae bacterium]
MKKLTLILLCASAIMWGGVVAVKAQTFNAVMDSVQPRPSSTSFSASVVRNGAVRYVGSRGNPDPGAAARYMLASVTKQFTAAAILALEADNKLDLDDPASRFLTALPHWNRITVRNLLNHQTTLPDYVSGMPYMGGAAFQSGISLSALLNIISTAAGVPTSRACLSYSNSNYAALTAIIEVAANQSFGSYLRSKIFQPLEMTQTSYTGGIQSDVARGHHGNGAPTGNYNTSWANGAGGIVTTARDMAKWNIAILDGFLDIAQRAQDDAVTGNCQFGGNPSSYAYGWIVGSNGVLEHSGVVEGYSTYNFVDIQRGVAVAVLTSFAGYSGGIAAFARTLSRATTGGSPGPTTASYCCTVVGRFGPGPNPTGQAGLSCTWFTPMTGWMAGQTCP